MDSIFDSTRELSDMKKPTLASHIVADHISNRTAMITARANGFKDRSITFVDEKMRHIIKQNRHSSVENNSPDFDNAETQRQELLKGQFSWRSSGGGVW